MKMFFFLLKTTEESKEWRNIQQTMKKALSSKHVDTEARQFSNGTLNFLRYFGIWFLSISIVYLLRPDSLRSVGRIEASG